MAISPAGVPLLWLLFKFKRQMVKTQFYTDHIISIFKSTNGQVLIQMSEGKNVYAKGDVQSFVDLFNNTPSK